MSLNMRLRRAKWALKGLAETGMDDFRVIGFGFVQEFSVRNGAIVFSAWASSKVRLVSPPRFVVTLNGERIYSQPLQYRFNEEASDYLHEKHSKKHGLNGFYNYTSDVTLDAQLEFETSKGVRRLPLGTIPPNCQKAACDPTIVDPWEKNQIGNITGGYYQCVKSRGAFGSGMPESSESIASPSPVDLVIPVYNGMEYLPNLFSSLKNTSVPHRYIIVNDCSPDENVAVFLAEFERTHKDSCTLLTNETNLGFVRSVNRGLEASTNDVVLINTDIEVPTGWLERLIEPIRRDRSIASVTPITNSGTICSFPTWLQNNNIPFGMSVNEVDSFFKEMEPVQSEVPTGVGFCMAMSRAAVQSVGLLDEAFGKGYGEENDWCQRAISHGFKNIILGNLFVYHKHGGSFPSEEKKRLLRHNEEVLRGKHPNYYSDVAKYIESDPLSEFRNYVYTCMKLSTQNRDVVIGFNHVLGGGAAHFFDKERQRLIDEGHLFATVSFSPYDSLYHVVLESSDHIEQFSARTFEAAVAPFDNVSTILVNELATYPNLPNALDAIRALRAKSGSTVTFYLHDYLAICPSLNLLGYDKYYCGVPQDRSACQRCYRKQGHSRWVYPETVRGYREQWKTMLEVCDKVVCFSEASKKLLLDAYPNLTNAVVTPHAVSPLRPVNRRRYRHEGINIGLLGNLSFHKGSEVVEALLKSCHEDGLDKQVRFVHFGDNLDNVTDDNFVSLNEYERSQLPDLVEQQQIDVFFLTSIWPETFSFTCSEIISMDVPLICFDMGAPAERTKQYDKGLVLPSPHSIDEEAQAILAAIIKFAREMSCNAF